ncbi:hypothetical protein ZIOFF_033236 [Zingiber officinale]|uniref:Uncharacterized protein n=1 Tax=Zingiber officinale TaxID=94328 RepID=A0A8J5GWR5_ZINOF|nr:hypothetical protein ZIOFF_033236 [Zingiber officinale]
MGGNSRPGVPMPQAEHTGNMTLAEIVTLLACHGKVMPFWSHSSLTHINYMSKVSSHLLSEREKDDLCQLVDTMVSLSIMYKSSKADPPEKSHKYGSSIDVVQLIIDPPLHDYANFKEYQSQHFVLSGAIQQILVHEVDKYRILRDSTVKSVNQFNENNNRGPDLANVDFGVTSAKKALSVTYEDDSKTKMSIDQIQNLASGNISVGKKSFSCGSNSRPLKKSSNNASSFFSRFRNATGSSAKNASTTIERDSWPLIFKYNEVGSIRVSQMQSNDRSGYVTCSYDEQIEEVVVVTVATFSVAASMTLLNKRSRFDNCSDCNVKAVISLLISKIFHSALISCGYAKVFLHVCFIGFRSNLRFRGSQHDLFSCPCNIVAVGQRIADFVEEGAKLEPLFLFSSPAPIPPALMVEALLEVHLVVVPSIPEFLLLFLPPDPITSATQASSSRSSLHFRSCYAQVGKDRALDPDLWSPQHGAVPTIAGDFLLPCPSLSPLPPLHAFGFRQEEGARSRGPLPDPSRHLRSVDDSRLWFLPVARLVTLPAEIWLPILREEGIFGTEMGYA